MLAQIAVFYFALLAIWTQVVGSAAAASSSLTPHVAVLLRILLQRGLWQQGQQQWLLLSLLLILVLLILLLHSADDSLCGFAASILSCFYLSSFWASTRTGTTTASQRPPFSAATLIHLSNVNVQCWWRPAPFVVFMQDAEEEDDVKEAQALLFLASAPLQAASSSLMGQLTNDKSMGGPSLTIQYYVEEERRVPLTQTLFLL